MACAGPKPTPATVKYASVASGNHCDRLAPGNACSTGVAHDLDAVFLGPTNLVVTVSRVFVQSESELGQPHSGRLQVGKILFRQRGFEYDGTGVDGHSAGVEVPEARHCGDSKSFDSDCVVRSALGVDFTGRDDAGDTPVDIARQKVHRFLPGSVIPEDDVAVGIDQAWGHSGSHCVHGDGGRIHLRFQVLTTADRGDHSIRSKDGVRSGHQRVLVISGNDGSNVDDREIGHHASCLFSASARVIPPTRALIRPRFATAAMMTSSSA